MTARRYAADGECNHVGDPMPDGGHWRRGVTGIILVCIVVAYVVSIVRLHPTNLFGLTGDDAIYLSSAKALAEGKGYVLPNLPGSPPATKYPVMYPWILSFVWRINNRFPSNLPLAIAISTAFGVGFLLTAFAMFRRFGGLSKIEALILAAYMALHPLVMFFGASVLSEMPFAFFALTSMIFADRVMRPNGGQLGSACCGALAGVSMLARILGFPIILGIVATGIVRRSWRQLGLFGVAAAPFAGAVAWSAFFSKKPAPITGASGLSLGWARTWTFYTDYAGIWKLGVPNLAILWAMLKNNAGMILRQPADLMLGPTFVRDSMVGRILVLVAAVATVAGIVRQARKYGWKPIHFCLLFYAPVVLAWNYPEDNRFFLPFWPLLVAGTWLEGKRVLTLVRSSLSQPHRTYQKGLAVAVGLTVAALACGVIENSVAGTRRLVERTSDDRHAILRDKKECYDWIRTQAPPGARVVAYEDAPAYLYTERETVSPMILTTDEFYEPQRLDEAASHLTDVAEAVGARYWIFADDDFDREWPAASRLTKAHLHQMEGSLAALYRASGGSVTVREADCLPGNVNPACSMGDKVRDTELFVGSETKRGATAQ